jgi:hypothetical protein
VNVHRSRQFVRAPGAKKRPRKRGREGWVLYAQWTQPRYPNRIAPAVLNETDATKKPRLSGAELDVLKKLDSTPA